MAFDAAGARVAPAVQCSSQVASSCRRTGKSMRCLVAGVRRGRLSSLQAGLKTVVTDKFLVFFVLLRNPFKQSLKRELGVKPQKFCRFLPRLLIAAELGIVNNQISVGSEVMR